MECLGCISVCMFVCVSMVDPLTENPSLKLSSCGFCSHSYTEPTQCDLPYTYIVGFLV